MNPPLKNIRKIGILRTGALGDLVVILPAVQALRNTYPEAEITLLGMPWYRDFLLPERAVADRIEVIPPLRPLRYEGHEADEREIAAFFHSMQRERFDIALHFQGKGIAAGAFLQRLGARITAGNTCPESVSLDYSVPYYPYQHEVIRYLEIAALLGASPVRPEPEIKVLPEEKRQLSELLRQRGVERPYVVLHPVARDLRRMWQADKFARLGDLLAGKGHTVIFSGTAGDEDKIRGIMGSMKAPALNLCGCCSLGMLAALLAESELVVSVDTGPLHLGRAAGARTVGIYWAPNFIKWGPLSFARHRAVISWELHCPRCGIIPNDPHPFEPGTPACDHAVSFLEHIGTGEVWAAAVQLLDSSENHPVPKGMARGKNPMPAKRDDHLLNKTT